MTSLTPKIFLETERLILRELIPEDAEAMFRMDSDPEVHTYLGNKPVQSLQETKDIIEFVQTQYHNFGIGRWAAIEKSTGAFIGWAGLKYFDKEVNKRIHFYDLGYRFKKKYWGLGYATEAAKACVEYGFNTLQLKEIHGMTDSGNRASRNVLEKAGLKFIEPFLFENDPSDWFMITREEFLEQKKS